MYLLLCRLKRSQNLSFDEALFKCQVKKEDKEAHRVPVGNTVAGTWVQNFYTSQILEKGFRRHRKMDRLFWYIFFQFFVWFYIVPTLEMSVGDFQLSLMEKDLRGLGTVMTYFRVEDYSRQIDTWIPMIRDTAVKLVNVPKLIEASDYI